MTESYKCVGADCQKRVYVVPVFEVESSEDIPANKTQLVNLMNENKAVYFHQLTCTHCQRFPGLDEWKETNPGNIVKVSLVKTIILLYCIKSSINSFTATVRNKTRTALPSLGTNLHWL